MAFFRVNKKQIHIISAVTFGNTLEWYEAYSYIFLAPVLSKVFFNSKSVESNLFFAFLVFGIGFIVRPIGGILFGRWGDLLGRKSAFVGSILIMTIPTFLMGCLPSYAEAGSWAPIGLIVLRLLQSLPESGEAPGSFCYLYETSGAKNKKFMTSWGAVGNQIGAILALLEVLIMEESVTEEVLFSWGWRISFWFGSLIGLLGFILRKTLDETPVFKELRSHHEIDRERVFRIIVNNWRRIVLGTSYGIINASTFYLIATYFPSHFNKVLGFDGYSNILISLSVLILTTILLPIFGFIGDRFSVKQLMIGSSFMIILLLFPMYFFFHAAMYSYVILVFYLYIIPISCITALIPFLLTQLFPASVRFTGVGITFNLADGFIGGFTPAISLLFAHYTNNEAAFCWFIFVCSAISLVSYFKIKD